jgi:serine/threonine protein kinase
MVALKLLRATFTKSERAVARFYREADTAARLKHRNLISVVDAGETNGLHFLVMELVEGRDVRSLVKEKGVLPVATAIDIILQAAQGLECAHQNGVIHRDIKPANLLYQANGRVVVLDLGLARLDDPVDEDEGEDNGRLTMPGHFLGTLDYVSPEQTADAHEVTARSDVYSLGCTLYYLLTGQPPYRRENAALILFAHCQDPIPKLAEDALGVSERLEKLFQGMMAKKAADRVATMTDVIAELEACRLELAGGNPAPAKRTARPVVAARQAASSEIAAEIREERTIELPPVSDDEEDEVDSPAATTTPDSLAGTFREISEADFTEVGQLAPSRKRRKSHMGWTIVLASLAIGALAAGGWIAAYGLPSWLR